MCTQGNSFSVKFAAIACNFDQGSYPVVLPNGDVYVTFNNGNTPTAVNHQLGVLVHVNGNTLTPTPPVKAGVDDETKIALCDFGRGPGNYDVVVSESHDGGAHWSDATGTGTVYFARCHSTTMSAARNTGIVIDNTRNSCPTRRSTRGISPRILSPCSNATVLACWENVTGRSYGGGI
jgi:hypothetical protein